MLNLPPIKNEQRSGLIYSAAVHFVILLLMVFGLPSWLIPSPPPQPMVISVDILPISEMTNVKPSDAPLSEKEKEPEPVAEEKPPTPPVKADAPTPPPPPPEPKPAEKPVEKPIEKKPEEKPKPVEKPKKPKEDDLDAVLKSLKESSEKEKKTDDKKDKKPKEDAGTKTKAKDAPYDPGLPMSMTELDAIRSQIAKCWNVPAGAKDAHELRVTVRVQLALDGSVTLVEIGSDSKSRYNSGDTFYRAAVDSAMRAVRQCSPLKNLPADKYQTWRDMEMTFDPKEMLY